MLETKIKTCNRIMVLWLTTRFEQLKQLWLQSSENLFHTSLIVKSSYYSDNWVLRSQVKQPQGFQLDLYFSSSSLLLNPRLSSSYFYLVSLNQILFSFDLDVIRILEGQATGKAFYILFCLWLGVFMLCFFFSPPPPLILKIWSRDCPP